MLTSDPEVTSRRRAALARYLTGAVDDGEELVCESAARCRASMKAGQQLVEGQLSHVGDQYDLTSSGRALRIVVVSKQVGGSLDHGGGRGHEHVSLARRSAQVETAKYGSMPHPRTNHMVGTELALKILLGGDTSYPPTVEIGQSRPHVFDCMALVNSTLCSRAGDNSSGVQAPSGSKLRYLFSVAPQRPNTGLRCHYAHESRPCFPVHSRMKVQPLRLALSCTQLFD